MLFVDVAGLLAWASLIAFPSRLKRTVAEVSATRMKNKNGNRINLFTIHCLPFTTFTATGIAPDLHRISLFIPMFNREPNQRQM
jgi:hypothetical protein